MSISAGGADAVAGLSALDDPVRQQLYEYVSSCDEPASREDAAAAAGISRTLAAYHLDKLAAAGILDVSYARPAGRGGPGAGRPAKRYARSQRELHASVPPRNYGLLAGLLADAVADDGSGAVRDAVATAARRAGHAAAAEGGLEQALRAIGYEPAASADGGIELRNCPFHQFSREHTALVCGLNLELIQGMLEAEAQSPARAELAPREGRCCVAIRPPERPRRGLFRGRGS